MSDQYPQNQDPGDRPTSGDNDNSVSCPICAASFSFPGWEPDQVSRALAQHIQGSHRGEDVDNWLSTTAEGKGKAPKVTPSETRSEGRGAGDLPWYRDERGSTVGGELPETGETLSGGDDGSEQTEEGAEESGSRLPGLRESAAKYDPAPGRESEDEEEATAAASGSRLPGLRESAAKYDPAPMRRPAPGEEDAEAPEGQQGKKQKTEDETCSRCGRPVRKPKSGPLAGYVGAGDSSLCNRCRAINASPLGRRLGQRRGERANQDAKAQGGTPKRSDPRTAAGRAGRAVNDRIDNGIKKGAAAAAQAAGVPAPVAQKFMNSKLGGRIVKATRIGILAPFIAWAVLITAIFGGSILSDSPEDEVWAVTAAEAMDIPEPYLRAYQQAASEHKIPWTLLAAVGRRATDHGRVNPYEAEVPGVGVGDVTYDGGISRVVHYADDVGGGAAPYIGPILQQLGIEYETRLGPGKGIQWVWDDIKQNPPENGSTVLINVGSFDTMSSEDFDRAFDGVMASLQVYSGRNVTYWVDLNAPGNPRSAEYNAVIQIKEGNTSAGIAKWLDWAGHSQAAGIQPGSDGLRYEAPGYQAMARFTVSQMTGVDLDSGGTGQEEEVQEGALPEPQGNCPTLPEPIEGETRTQGWGPLMLKPAGLSGAGFELGEKVQNICESASALAEIIAESAQIVGEEKGYGFPSGIALIARNAGRGDAAAADTVHKFWADVVDRTNVLGDRERSECGFPDRGDLAEDIHVGAMINTHWGCVLNNAELRAVAEVTASTTGVLSYSELSSARAVARGVQEALSVAWTYSSWGSAECDAAAAVAGVFPLTEAGFRSAVPERWTGKGRCDKQANIAAAAVLFARGESSVPSTRPGTWQASIGGWTRMPLVAGPEVTTFDSLGPWKPLSVVPACARILVNELARVGADPAVFEGRTAAQVQSYISDGIPEGDVAAVDAVLDAIVGKARADTSCTTTRTHADSEWLGVLSGAFNGDLLTNAETGASGTGTLPRLTVGDLTVTRGTGDVLAALATRAFTRSSIEPAKAEVGVTALLVRLSPVLIEVPVRPGLPRSGRNEDLTVGSQLVNIAVGFYGGIFVTASGSAIGGIGLVGPEIPFADLFNSVGQEYGMDPRILAAVAKQESEFNPEAGCPHDGSGATGMMQKENDASPTLCGDPRRQVQVAAEMLKARYEEAGQDWRGALWGYNNGPVFSNKWREIAGNLTEAEGFAAQRYASRPGRADVAMDYISDDPGVRSAWGTYLAYQQQFPSTVINTFQTQVNGTECPTARVSQIAGKTLLREGADRVGMRQLCVDSVAQAPTPEAAKAIIFAFNNLGVPYSQDNRNSIRFDCSSYVSRAYQSAGILMNSGGNAYSTHTLLPRAGYTRPAWIVQVADYEALPGDLMFPFEGHVVMVLANGYMTHAPATGDVVHVRKAYRTPLQINRVVPELAQRIAPRT